MALTASIPDGSALAPPATLAVAVTADARRLDAWLLALRARGIPALLQRIDGAIALHVLPVHHDAARTEVEAVDAEEREARSAAVVVPRDDDSKLAPLGGALFALLLVGFYLVTGPSALRSFWFDAGSSDAVRVLAGEWWRSVTALTLHTDSNHVLSNIAIGGVVVTMVMHRTGVGLGAALVVLSGVLGNLINAWAYGIHHNSIGFSTAVFGAIGLLGGLTFVSSLRTPLGTRGRRPAWIAIAGSLALLAMLGASPRTDLLAHLFGLFAGLALGLGVGATELRPRSWFGQTAWGLVTLALVGGAWAVAL
jgi:membrane associated rhomboid family serine protease